jgi:hypothetical protein
VKAIDAVRGLKPRTVYIRDAALEAVARDLKGIPREKP